jgi:hypothetical protein
MAAQRKYPDELRERAAKMLFEVREREGKGHGSWPGSHVKFRRRVAHDHVLALSTPRLIAGIRGAVSRSALSHFRWLPGVLMCHDRS